MVQRSQGSYHKTMKTLAILIAAFTPAMLVIHLSTARILKAWNGEADSWIKRQFPPRRALRVEALYWMLTLAAWPLWRAPAWEIAVVLFSGIHLSIWLVGELRPIHLTDHREGVGALTRRLHRTIIAFDLIEAVVLVAVGGVALLFAVAGGAAV